MNALTSNCRAHRLIFAAASRRCLAVQRQASCSNSGSKITGQYDFSGLMFMPAILPAGRENFAGKIILVVLLVIGAVWFLMATLNHLGSERQAAARISGSQ